jgi:hypothetical protein
MPVLVSEQSARRSGQAKRFSAPTNNIARQTGMREKPVAVGTAGAAHAMRAGILASGRMSEYAHANHGNASFPPASVTPCSPISNFEIRNKFKLPSGENDRSPRDVAWSEIQTEIRFEFPDLNIRYTESFRVLATFCRSCFELRISSSEFSAHG